MTAATSKQHLSKKLSDLRRALEDAGSSWKETAKVNCSVRRKSDLAEYNQIYREFFSTLPSENHDDELLAVDNPV